ncbi:putative methionyl-tRNA synthetase [Hordeum vulgare]|nr:putative methionyl-tRNA synthetase [Hordeum vulgare]
MSGSVATVSYPGFDVQHETMDTAVDMDNEHEDAEYEEEGRKSRRRRNRNQYRKRERRSGHRTLGRENLTQVDVHGTQMVRMFNMYRQDNSDQEFKFLHVFSRIGSCKKWRDVRLDLAKVKETYNLNMPSPTVTEGCPNGKKRANAARDTMPSAEGLQFSIEQYIVDANNSPAKRKEKSDARWSVSMTNQDVKLDLLRTNVVAKKRNTDLAFLMAADMSTMDELVKVWYLAESDLILNQMPVPATTTTATPTMMPSPST